MTDQIHRSSTGVDVPGVSRRDLLKGGVAGATAIALTALAGQQAAAGRGVTPARGPRKGGYGPVRPAVDQATGLELLALPEGFTYFSYGWTGQTMSDGRPTPTDHDGMAVVAKRGRDICLVRNHELSQGESAQAIVEGGTYNPDEYGGTTNLVFDTVAGRFTDSYTSLGGTIRNCAGGPTPWSSWISCEETFHPWGSRDDGVNHGYVFDVPGFGISDGRAITAAGRFSHEAVAVDPKTGIVYETEDAGSSALYRYLNPAGKKGIADGGELQAMVVRGTSRFDLTQGFAAGTTFPITWEAVGDPEGRTGRAFDSAPDAAVISRGEGAWWDAGLCWFVSTDGGAAGLGQVWALDPKRDELTMVYESPSSSEVDGPDNITISPRGGIVLCEDGDSNPKRLVGLSQRGEVFTLVENRIDLGPGDLARIDDVFPGVGADFWDNRSDEPDEDGVGDYASSEWAGATFHRDWLFANVQSPGVTFAITGPWQRGAL
ncbi:alkaline phosphatase PhoX [Ilumatobacter sp.]|uniref:alkaline phosphatase PhoX n=1 Tax=Ilumatobacter sp. TaxID=1967498 RepID=UPI003B51C014